MAWPNAILELRQKLSDGDTDKLRAIKRCVGNSDGVNVTFKTFEYRRLTNFTSGSFPVGVYADGVILPSAAIASDDLSTGFFALTGAFPAGTVIEATYYLQWFLDAELVNFIISGSLWLGFSEDYTQTPAGLKPSVLSWAAGEAYQKLALRWTEQIADVYQLQGAPKEDTRTPVDYYTKLSKMFFDEALSRRNEYYRRQGQPLQPLFSFVNCPIPPVAPNR